MPHGGNDIRRQGDLSRFMLSDRHPGNTFNNGCYGPLKVIDDVTFVCPSHGCFCDRAMTASLTAL